MTIRHCFLLKTTVSLVALAVLGYPDGVLARSYGSDAVTVDFSQVAAAPVPLPVMEVAMAPSSLGAGYTNVRPLSAPIRGAANPAAIARAEEYKAIVRSTEKIETAELLPQAPKATALAGPVSNDHLLKAAQAAPQPVQAMLAEADVVQAAPPPSAVIAQVIISGAPDNAVPIQQAKIEAPRAVAVAEAGQASPPKTQITAPQQEPMAGVEMVSARRASIPDGEKAPAPRTTITKVIAREETRREKDAIVHEQYVELPIIRQPAEPNEDAPRAQTVAMIVPPKPEVAGLSAGGALQDYFGSGDEETLPELPPVQQAVLEQPAQQAETQRAEFTPVKNQPAQKVAASSSAVTNPQADRLIFPVNATDVGDVGAVPLNQWAEKLKDDPRTHVQVKAYASKTDNSTSEARRVAMKRGLAVRNYLVDKGVPSNRIDVRALGYVEDAVNPPDRVDIVGM